jgi:hypothetical protein
MATNSEKTEKAKPPEKPTKAGTKEPRKEKDDHELDADGEGPTKFQP